jgi:DNA-binding MarR family transcriptional regulator
MRARSIRLVMLAPWGRAPLSVREISGLLQFDPGTLSPLLKRLEAAGYVRRRRDPDDERSLAVSLTEAGRALRAEAEKIRRPSSRASAYPSRNWNHRMPHSPG